MQHAQSTRIKYIYRSTQFGKMIRLASTRGGPLLAGRTSRGLYGPSRALRCFSAGGDEKKGPPKGIPYSKLTVGIPKEHFPLERRVAASPESVKRMVAPGFNVMIEDGAGAKSHFSNQDYEAVGATIAPSADELWKKSDVVLKLRPPSSEEVALLEDKTLVSFIYPQQNKELVQQLQDQKATVFAMDSIPRTLSRGQTYDALSSQANIAGYRAVLEASNEFGRFFAGQMTAAGKVPPAKVLVIGTGVAGLAAIQTAKNLGAVVRNFEKIKITVYLLVVSYLTLSFFFCFSNRFVLLMFVP